MKNIINKNYTNSLLIVLLVILLSSCEDRIDILPEDNTVNDVVFSNGALAQGAVIGIYNRAKQDAVLNGTPQLIGEWQSDNSLFEGTFNTFEDISQYATLASNSNIFTIWDDHYEVIGAANLVIDNIPLVEDISYTDEQRAQGIAEARFLRALAYFQLSLYYGQPLQIGSGRGNLSVPLVVTSETGVVIPRNTLGEVQDFVESELLAVGSILPADTRSRANSGTVRALLARLYLYQERFSEAVTMADSVISDSFYALAPDYSFFGASASTSTEIIFAIPNNAVDGQTTSQGWSGLTNPRPNGRGDTPFSQNLLDVYAEEPGDLRFSTLMQTGPGAEGVERIFPAKFPDAVNFLDDGIVIRITEMYLTRAEANLRASTTVGAAPLDDINELRSRAGLVDLGTVDLAIILNERRKELAFEGQRRMDLLRNGMNLRRPGQENAVLSVPGADKTIFPIPQQVRDLSPILDQNTGY